MRYLHVTFVPQAKSIIAVGSYLPEPKSEDEASVDGNNLPDDYMAVPNAPGGELDDIHAVFARGDFGDLNEKQRYEKCKSELSVKLGA